MPGRTASVCGKPEEAESGEFSRGKSTKFYKVIYLGAIL